MTDEEAGDHGADGAADHAPEVEDDGSLALQVITADFGRKSLEAQEMLWHAHKDFFLSIYFD